MSKGFGLVQPTLIQQIKKILDQYPDDGQILKELIQNAEDAGAREVTFLYDEHSYGTNKLCHRQLAKFQGPALYAYNDAKFTDDDWDGIGLLCDSFKEKDPTKVGRFGLGFKSVFHMTDLPSVISGDSVGIIDPEEKYFSDDDGKRSGRKWHLRKERKTSDQFAPYKGIFGCDDKSFERGSYEGTLFRLPLRQEASKLSNTIYSQEKMRGLFECFEKDAHLILLFLMNLERIEVYEREEHSSQPRKLFHVGISDDCLEEVREAREEFEIEKQNNVSALSSGSLFPEVKKTYTLTIETVHYDDDETQSTRLEHSYVVTLFFSGSDVTQEIKALMTDKSLSYLPLVGVALPLQPQMRQNACREESVDTESDHDDYDYAEDDEDDDADEDNDDENNDENDDDDKDDDDDDVDDDEVIGWSENNNVDAEPQGHVFCFLPLPLERRSLTGLPVHVNGFFALSQNRRHLKWPSADQDETLTDKSLLWNKGLLQEVLPKAYAELIFHVISCLPEEEPRQMMTKSDAYSAWPDLDKVNVKWKEILQPLFDILLQSEVLHTDANGGDWCRAEDVMLDDLKKSDESRKIVIDVLTKTGNNVVTAPSHVKTALLEYCTFELEYVTPEILRSSLKARPSCYSHLNHQDKIKLLKFVLKDYDFTELEGLELLPLADKTFTTFGEEWYDPIYIDSNEHPMSLLPGLKKMFLDTELDDAVMEQLKNAAVKGYTQLRHFNVETVKRHLRQTLPSDWLDSEVHVTWYPGSSKQPTIKWFKALWEYFGSHFAHTASHLDAFVGLPLVPVTPISNQTEVQLARIQRPSSLVLASFNGESIDESVCHVLEDLGLTILKDLPEYIRYYPGLVPYYANPPSPKGVLNAMGVIFKSPQKKSDILQRMRGLPADKIRSFRRFLSSISSPLKKFDFNLLQILPLFETFPGCGGKESLFVSVEEVNIGAPIDGLPPVRVFTELLDLRDHSSSVLAHLLGIQPMSHNDLLKIMLDDALENKYRQNELDGLVKYILDRFGIFRGEDFKTIKQKLQLLSFVLSSGNSRKKPSELYDPEKLLLKQVFYGEDVFPAENSYYSQPDVLSHLRKLGLKGTEFVTASDILKSAKLQHKKKPITVSTAETKFQGILKLLEHNPSLLEDKVFRPGLRKTKLKNTALKSHLHSIPWIPVLAEKPATYPTHLALKKIENGYFACPKDVISHKFINLVGSVKLLVDTRHIPRVSMCFKWEQQPLIQDVIGHLDNVIKIFQESNDLDKRRAREVLEEMYEYFQKYSKDDEIKKLLSPKNFILVYKQLFPARKLAFSSNVIYPPYLSQLPDSYKHSFRELFKAVGVRNSFEIRDYIETLQMVKKKYGENPITEELSQVTSVLNSLAEVMTKEEICAKEAIYKYGSIYIPDSNEIMKPSVNVCVKDCYWMPSEPDVSYINEGVLPQVCITLGAKTIRQKTLGKHVIPLGVPFGQKEKLTNRLKRILTGYPCDESIMKELLQNADDAKATKVCFIKDPRQHPDEKVFEDSWKPLQGPALCVYNNAPFTKSDIEGIQNLGEGSKGDDPNKTGQYGVGFNAVYHLTDAPTFISQGEEIGEVMCVFDPNLKFAPGADESSPGVMYDNISYLKEIFTDVFPCYLGEHFPIDNATMFRFPLRDEKIADESKICNTPITTEDLDNLLDSFKKEMLNVLLFVNNVKEISLFEIDKETEKMIEKYGVKASLSEDDEEKRREFAARVNEIGKRLQREEMLISDVPVHQVSYTVNLEDSEGVSQKWFVVQKIGFENPKEIPDAVIKAFKKGDLGLLPRGGVASLICSSENPPGKAFCFLPLPFNTGLPVHINGHFALDHEARRNLWRDERGDYRSDWNDALLRQVVAPCYVTLLDEIRQLISLPVNANRTNLSCSRDDAEQILHSSYASRFPSLSTREVYWETLTKEVYRYMDEKGIRLLPVLRQDKNTDEQEKVFIDWLPPTGEGREEALFGTLIKELPKDYHELDDKKKESVKKRCRSLRDTLLAVGVNLLCMPMRVYECFKESEVDVSLISPADVIRFFGTYNTPNQLCNVGCLPSNIQDTPFKSVDNLLVVLKYCSKYEEFWQHLDGLPLLLTQDGVVRVLSSEDPVFLSGYSEIVPHSRSIFVHREMFNTVFYPKDDSAISPVFKDFDITAFANLLPRELSQDIYKSTDEYVIWDPEDRDRIPNKRWIMHVWRFFSNYVKKLVDEEKRRNMKKGIPKDLSYEEMRLNEKLEHRRIMQKALSPVNEWCLLPATETEKEGYRVTAVRHLLVPLALAKSVIHFHSSDSFSLQRELQKMVLPELNSIILDAGSVYTVQSFSELAKDLVASLSEPTSILTLLVQKLKRNPKALNGLMKDSYEQVLCFFNEHIKLFDNDQDSEDLKALPFYTTIHGESISIKEMQAIVLSDSIPKNDMHIWQETSMIAFLKEDVRLKDLYAFLGCDSKNAIDLYCDIIFEKFHEMSEEARLEHLSFLRSLLVDSYVLLKHQKDRVQSEEKKKLLRELRKLKFIPDKLGSLKTASSFYDPSNEVFNVMYASNPDVFPPKPFCEWEWLHFLRQIGLIHEVNNEQFVQFAKEVETEAKTRPSDAATKKKSETLVNYLFKIENVATDRLLDDVREICFIVPVSVDSSLQRLHKQHGMKPNGLPNYICFKDSVASDDDYICWTSANLLPYSADPSNFYEVNPNYEGKTKLNNRRNYQERIFQRLGILKKPTADMVVTHCKTICKVLGQEKATKDPHLVLRIMTSIYEYLKRNYNGNKEVVNELKNIRCIVVDDGKRFVFPYQIAVDITSEQEIPPYLYKIPLEIGAFAEFFQNLGTTNTVTAAQYSMVLKSIHDESGDEKLHPNEIRNAFKATKGLFETIGKMKEVQAQEISPLYLPGEKQNPDDDHQPFVFLQRSTNLVFNDAPNFKERIKCFERLLLVKLEKCELEVSNDDLLVKKLPESLRPRMLTSVVHETLVEESKPIPCSSTAHELREILTSGEFCHGLIRMIRQSNYENEVQISRDTLINVRQKLSCIYVYGVSHLRTRLVCNDKAIPKSETNVSCFGEKEETEERETWKIYVEEGADLKKYFSRVAIIVDRMTGSLLGKEMLTHLPIMLSLMRCEIKSFLDDLGVREDNSFPDVNTSYLPSAGNYIHIDDHHLLVDAIVVFSPGDYVGYEVDDPSLRGEEGTPTYIYAIVIEEVTEDGQPSTAASSRRYRINIGKDKESIVVDAADLYMFKRPDKLSNDWLELKVYCGPSSDKAKQTENLGEVLDRITRILEDAWRLPEEKRRKIIKRLFLTWHPDKNPGNEEFCTKVFQFIQGKIEKLEKGESVGPWRASGYSYSGFYGSFFNRWSGRARYHSGQSSSFYGGGGFSTFFGGSYRRNPQPSEAKRWFNQAKADLEAASNDVLCQRTSFEWACFKCHQSAEKALKAAQYSKDADKTSTHSLTALAQELNSSTLQSLASQLECLVGNSMRMRYPDQVTAPNIPHDVYYKETALRAMEISSEILKDVKSNYVN